MTGIEEAIGALCAALPPGRVTTDATERAARRNDYWALSTILERSGRGAPPPAAVVLPASVDEVATVLRIAQERRVAVVTRGGGSGVCGGVLPGADAIVLDTTSMNRLISVCRESLTATAECGLNGREFERLLNEHGLTLGHFPQSIDLSTVGGWVATRASGQLSTRYGNIEDMVLALEAVLPGGTIVRTFESPRAATGPDIRALLLGSEGTLGVITRITFKVWPLATWQKGFAVAFDSFEAGLDASREILQAGWRPAVLRLYDEVEAGRHFQAVTPGLQGHVLLVMSEGADVMGDALTHELAAALAVCQRLGAREIGENPLRQWLSHRNEVPSWEQLLAKGLVVDTIEVAATWDRIRPLYDAVTGAIQATDGIIAATGHTSHGYSTGVNIYFTFVGMSQDPTEQERIYRAAWDAAMRATTKCGATISHHHGIGRVRREWLPQEVGEGGMAVLRAVKQALDPHGILNPGVLLS